MSLRSSLGSLLTPHYILLLYSTFLGFSCGFLLSSPWKSGPVSNTRSFGQSPDAAQTWVSPPEHLTCCFYSEAVPLLFLCCVILPSMPLRPHCATHHTLAHS